MEKIKISKTPSPDLYNPDVLMLAEKTNELIDENAKLRECVKWLALNMDIDTKLVAQTKINEILK